ncbi:hypothetical protein WJX74_004428 [Apatococcus lobatus]|uniref:Acyltransferase 3 domain-containing protein n=1 Tax=Apatococcus lobatus TaxID=904363 RepID=A0AAW1QAH1_9CHLO
MFAMDAFFIMSGLLAAKSLIPSLTAAKNTSSQVLTGYYTKRCWRILPAYYLALVINAASKAWPRTWSNYSEEAGRVREYFNLGLKGSRAGWTLPLLISNITLDMRSFLFSWNVPIQMQFYLLLPLIILFLRPQTPFFRHRLAWTCAVVAIAATLYRVWVVFTFNLQGVLPIGSHTHAASHDAASVAAAWSFLTWLYASFMSRAMDFALGVLLYLITSSDRACALLRSHARTCTATSALTAAFAISACFGPMDIRPQPDRVDPITARLGVHVLAFGVVFPSITAWLMLYTLVRPDQPSTWAAAFLGSRSWGWLSDRTYSVFLLHPFVAYGLFQAMPVTSVIGPLESLSTYAAVCGLVAVTSFGLAWVQDILLEKFVKQAAQSHGNVQGSSGLTWRQPTSRTKIVAAAA